MNKKLLIIFFISFSLFLFFAKDIFAVPTCGLSMDFCRQRIGSPPEANTCCRDSSCPNTACGTISRWDFCHAQCCGFRVPPPDPWLCAGEPGSIHCYSGFHYIYTYRTCLATDSCRNTRFLQPGICDSTGCVKGGDYKICCDNDGSGAVCPNNCEGGNTTGRCPSGCNNPGPNILECPRTAPAPAPAITLTATPSSIRSGSSSRLEWSSTNTTSCTWRAGLSGSTPLAGWVDVWPTTTTTYTIECTGAGGTAPASVTVTVTAVGAPTASISASPNPVASGAATTLSWGSTNATSCTATAGSGFSTGGAVSGSDASAALTAATTFTVRCDGAVGTTPATASVTVRITGAPGQCPASCCMTDTAGNQYVLTGLSSTGDWACNDFPGCRSSAWVCCPYGCNAGVCNPPPSTSDPGPMPDPDPMPDPPIPDPIPDPIPNQPPLAINLSVTQANYCGYTYPSIFLRWQFSDPDPGASQFAYQVQVDNDTNLGPDPWDATPPRDSGKVTGIPGRGMSYAPPNLSFNTTYNWRVRVWDNQDLASAWLVGSPIITDSHRYPTPDFTWSPLSPTVNGLIRFTDTSVCYDVDGRCNAWRWDFGDGAILSNIQHSTHRYAQNREYTITLRVTDGAGYACSISKTLRTEPPLPEYREIAPFGWMRKFLAGFADFVNNF